MQLAGKMPGTKSQYDNVTQIYQALVDKGVTPQVALDLTNQKVAEKVGLDLLLEIIKIS